MKHDFFRSFGTNPTYYSLKCEILFLQQYFILSINVLPYAVLKIFTLGSRSGSQTENQALNKTILAHLVFLTRGLILVILDSSLRQDNR